MVRRFNISLQCMMFVLFFSVGSRLLAAHPNGVVWEGDSGPGKGKHIVFIAGDHEYRGEESLPALARILAKHYGFKCSFFVTTDPKDGTINPGSNHITGLEALKSADLMVLFTRFQAFADDQMQHIDDYLATGKPVIGLRTTTHGFKGLKGKFARYNDGYKGDDKNGKPVLAKRFWANIGSVTTVAIINRALVCCSNQASWNIPFYAASKMCIRNAVATTPILAQEVRFSQKARF